MSETIAPTAENPGKTLGVIGLVLAIVAWPIGLIVSFVAKSKSKRAGFKNGPATAGIVLSVLALVITGIVIATAVAGISAVAAQCAEYGPGVHELDTGVTITCG